MEQFPGPERSVLQPPPPPIAAPTAFTPPKAKATTIAKPKRPLAKGEAPREGAVAKAERPNKMFAFVSFRETKRSPAILQAPNVTELKKLLRAEGDAISDVHMVIRGRALPVKEERVVRIG